MDFALETAALGPFRPLYCGAGSIDVLLQHDAEERRDDASSGDERATKCA